MRRGRNQHRRVGRRSRLSVKALRLYDERGVLVPACVDEASGYRFYDEGQLEVARLVAIMRQLGLSLTEIKELLACDPVESAKRVAAFGRRWSSRTMLAATSPTTSSTD